jgi:hypothetical protein
MIKLIVLTNGLFLLSQIEEIGADIGEPDCKLIEPFVLNSDQTLVPWMVDYTMENTFMISSEKILTLTEPKPTLLEKYQNLIK